LELPFDISATAEVSDFEIGTKVGYDKAHDKITLIRENERGLGLGELPKIWVFPLIFQQI